MAAVFPFVFAVVLICGFSACRDTVPTGAGGIPLPQPGHPLSPRPELQSCAVSLHSGMTYVEIAMAAYGLRRQCGLTDEAIRRRVREVFSAAGAGVIAQTESPIPFQQVKADKR